MVLKNDIREFTIDSAHAVTVPGSVAGWTRIHEDYGRLPLTDLLAPAIEFAASGYPVHSRIAWDWTRNVHRITGNVDASRIYLPKGRPPRVGEIHRQPQLAETLKTIAREGWKGFYIGPVAKAIVNTLRRRGGLHTEEDFALQQAEYVKSIATNYRGLDIVQCPPNGMGIVVLVMLNILSGFDLSKLNPMSPQRFHLQGEVAQLAFRAVMDYIGDPAQVTMPVDEILSAHFADRLRSRICLDRAIHTDKVSVPMHPNTVYLTVVDKDRNVMSFINSLFHTFGSGIVCPETGVLLQNRGLGFVLNPGHPNCIAPHKRPLHTILPAILMKGDRPILSFAVMGGYYQPVGQTQVLTNILDYGMDVQEAIDFPRGFLFDEIYQLEQGIPEEVACALERLGYRVVRNEAPLGGAQAIQINWSNGVLTGGSDSRKDGCALGY